MSPVVGSASPDRVRVETPRGPGELIIDAPAAPSAVLLLGHGAGGGIDAFDLSALAAELPGYGIAVVRYAQPWLVAGRKIAGPPASLDSAWLPAVAAVTAMFPGLPLFVGGHSAGARVACRCFDDSMVGVVALSFPLHPPGKPEKSRAAELLSVRGPVLVVQGERDPFGSPSEVRAAVEHSATAVGEGSEANLVAGPELSGAVDNSSAASDGIARRPADEPDGGQSVGRIGIVAVPAAGHSLQPGKRSDPDGARALIVDAVRDFITGR